MRRQLSARAVAVVAAVAMLTLALAAPGSSSGPQAGSLSVSPRANYVGGQALTFTGNIGASGQRTIKLQSYMGRPGDTWEPLPGFSGRTESDGDFSFRFRAPAMKNIQYRVVSGSLRTPSVTFLALSQDLVLDVVGGTALAGVPFVVEVDTTPDDLFGAPDTKLLEPITGRGLTLQERVDGDTWRTIGQDTVGQDGLGTFTVTESEPGTHVYRARQEDWTRDGNEIGWFPSFPTYVEVEDVLARPAPQPARSRLACVEPNTGDAAGPTAAGANKWGASVFDFAWVAGESLTSRPYKGTRKRGKWIDYSDGGGRASRNNGGLMLDSKRDNRCGPGDFGTTRATLQGNARSTGRWEVRLRLRSDEKGVRDYRTLAELVPERAADYDCGAHNIVIAELSPHASSYSFGAFAGKSRWWGTQRSGQMNNVPHNFAVELGKKHITWFFQGKPVGTVKSAAVTSGMPMTLRLSLEGQGDAEMNHTHLISDWQRGFSLGSGTQNKSGGALRKSTSAPAC